MNVQELVRASEERAAEARRIRPSYHIETIMAGTAPELRIELSANQAHVLQGILRHAMRIGNELGLVGVRVTDARMCSNWWDCDIHGEVVDFRSSQSTAGASAPSDSKTYTHMRYGAIFRKDGTTYVGPLPPPAPEERER